MCASPVIPSFLQGRRRRRGRLWPCISFLLTPVLEEGQWCPSLRSGPLVGQTLLTTLKPEVRMGMVDTSTDSAPLLQDHLSTCTCVCSLFHHFSTHEVPLLQTTFLQRPNPQLPHSIQDHLSIETNPWPHYSVFHHT